MYTPVENSYSAARSLLYSPRVNPDAIIERIVDKPSIVSPEHVIPAFHRGAGAVAEIFDGLDRSLAEFDPNSYISWNSSDDREIPQLRRKRDPYTLKLSEQVPFTDEKNGKRYVFDHATYTIGRYSNTIGFVAEEDGKRFCISFKIGDPHSNLRGAQTIEVHRLWNDENGEQYEWLKLIYREHQLVANMESNTGLGTPAERLDILQNSFQAFSDFVNMGHSFVDGTFQDFNQSRHATTQ